MQTILVIDDDEGLRDTIGLMLENEGYKPLLVGDGAAGLALALSAKPDLMLIDLRMPGFERRRSLQATARGGYEDTGHRAECDGGRVG